MIGNGNATRAYPGLLYAKSLERGGNGAAEFRIWFSHLQIAPFASRIEELRQSFVWQSGDCRNEPVMFVESDNRGNALVVRFLDDGQDAFGRPGTLRQEALIVPESEAWIFVRKTLSTIPDVETQTFRVSFSAPPNDFLKTPNVAVTGVPGTFSLSAMGMIAHAQVTTEAQPSSEIIAPRRTVGFWMVLAFAAIATVTVGTVFAVSPKGMRRENRNLHSEVRKLKYERANLIETNKVLLTRVREKEDLLTKTNSENAHKLDEAQRFYLMLENVLNDAPDFLKPSEEDPLRHQGTKNTEKP